MDNWGLPYFAKFHKKKCRIFSTITARERVALQNNTLLEYYIYIYICKVNLYYFKNILEICSSLSEKYKTIAIIFVCNLFLKLLQRHDFIVFT